MMTAAEYLHNQSRYRNLSKRLAQLEAQILRNQHDPVALAELRAEHRQVTSELSIILINNIEQSGHGTN
ncbi:hypothetical protein ACFSR6_03435 [Pedobacter vanadiisoli]|uniref:Uncharacterized protein n=1 Tax=Pedobacter vanadiisoli TaxID=1761975 RepID=A0ABW5ME55_9SPHI